MAHIEALEDRRLLAVGDLLHTLLPDTSNDTGTVTGDIFGAAVAADGDHVVVGSSLDDTGANNAGSAYVYDLSSGTPTLLVTLNNPEPDAGDEFGFSVDIEGNHVVVGAFHESPGGVSQAGIAYVFDLDSADPTVPMATLENPTPDTSDEFGYSVAISGDHVVVGARHEDTDAGDAGIAYVYDLSGSTSTLLHTLNNPSPSVQDHFGDAVSIEGDMVVIGNHRADDTGTKSGRVYVYDLSTASPDIPIATLPNPTPNDGDEFGYSVAVSAGHLVVGATGDDTGATGAGIAYVYDLSSLSTAPVTLNHPSPATNDEFGQSVAIADDYLVVGAYGNDTTGVVKAGIAYVYDLTSLSSPLATLSLTQRLPMATCSGAPSPWQMVLR